MKECFKCKVTYPLNFFKFRNKPKGIKFSYCNKCMIVYRHDHYLKNKSYYLKKAFERNHRIRIERTKLLINYLSTHPCVDCGNNNPIVLEFDHKDEKKKDFNISSIITWASMQKIDKEIDKCEIRCANCHKIKTAHQRKWFKANKVHNGV